MLVITETAPLADFCGRLATVPWFTIDTEFIRESTYYPRLCLIQLAGPDQGQEAIVDPLAPGLDLAPLVDLLDKPDVVKVFHAARQDLEIFYHLNGRLPAPLFDTQVAAMVCGFGDQVSYEKLAGALAGTQIDKSARFTDWARRPLAKRALDYALSDVTHLRKVYRKLCEQLVQSDRIGWLAEEMAILADPATYRTEPEQAWKRLKPRGRSRKQFALLQALAAWRERTAQQKDLPRNRVIKDEQLFDLAAQAPTTAEALAATRGLSADFSRSKMGREIVETVAGVLAQPSESWPAPPADDNLAPVPGPLVELLKVLLKQRCDEAQVAPKLVAGVSDLEAILRDDEADVPALHGWRRALFGNDALALKHGRLALAAGGGQVRVVPVPEG